MDMNPQKIKTFLPKYMRMKWESRMTVEKLWRLGICLGSTHKFKYLGTKSSVK